MHQVLFTVAGHPVPTHEVFVILGFLAGLAVFAYECRSRGAWDERLIPMIAGIVIGGALGARLGGWVTGTIEHGPGVLLWAWDQMGRSILGGLAGAYAGALIGKRLGGYQGRTGNLFAAAAVLGLAVGRIGCFLSEAPGRPTSLPWGITVDPALPIPECPGCLSGEAMHPSFLYEIAFLLVLFAVLWRLRRRMTAPGALFVVFLASYAVFRFGVEFTRANPPLVWGLTGSQVFLLVLSPLIAWRVWVLWRAGGFRSPEGAAAFPPIRDHDYVQ